MAEPHSLSKPIFYVGLGNRTVTNVPAMGARERTAGNVQLRDLGSRGFVKAGDKLCWGVQVRAVPCGPSVTCPVTAQQPDSACDDQLVVCVHAFWCVCISCFHWKYPVCTVLHIVHLSSILSAHLAMCSSGTLAVRVSGSG
jgi:hypothetical protein